MNDNELERTLRLYRPVGPPPALRKAVVHSTGRVIPASTWMPTAAALMAAAVLYWLSAYERAAVRVSVDRAAVARAANVELVARILGGGPQSLGVARILVLMDEPKEAAIAAPPGDRSRVPEHAELVQSRSLATLRSSWAV